MKLKDLQVPTDGSFKLKTIDPSFTGNFKHRDSVETKLASDIEELSELQSKLYAQDIHAVLIMFQAMDAGGKDGVIKHVLTGVNPQGVDVTSFKVPSAEERAHDYLWRAVRALPPKGKIGIFNRSYYEEVLVVRVHPEVLEAEQLPQDQLSANIWHDRFADINNFENYLVRNGTMILKFHLAISKEEQKTRLLKRIDHTEKNYKITPEDIKERDYWDDYMHAYEEMLRHTSTDWAPWYIIPSDHKWFTRIAVANILVKQLKSLKLEYPAATEARIQELKQARKLLTHKGQG